MQIPLQITFRHLEPSAAIENKIKAQVQKLEKHYDRITGCKVVVEAPHQHHHKGKLYRTEVDLTIPGEEIVANRNPHLNHAHEDVYVAIRDAFRAARRKLGNQVKRRRGHVKAHSLNGHKPLNGE